MDNTPAYANHEGSRTSELPMPAAGGKAMRFALLRWLYRFSFCDWLVLAYISNLNLRAWLAPEGAARTQSVQTLGALFAFFSLGLVLTRAVEVPFWGALIHRMGHFAVAVGSYLSFAEFLPLVNHQAFDAELYALDLALFGFEPAVYFDQFVTPFTTEWFAFFYFGYFVLLLLHVGPLLFAARSERILIHFAAGMLVVCCVGQSLYMVVPGFGPTHAFPELFTREFPDGLWWNWVASVVASGGAQKDIFPSLHTALPLFVLLFSFDNRSRAPFCYTWPLIAFIVANIIIATMFLRWHYVIDVVAGVALGTLAQVVASRLSVWEPARRRTLGLGPTWPGYGIPGGS